MTKHFVVLLISVIAFSLVGISESKAQANWEVGMRFGDPLVSFEATVPLGIKPRLHPTVAVARDFGIGTYFDWMFALSGGPQGLKFFPGVGPDMKFGNDFDIGVYGNFGAEYSFDFPLTVGFDWRPGFEFTDADFQAGRWGFSARFRFGEGVKFKSAD